MRHAPLSALTALTALLCAPVALADAPSCETLRSLITSGQQKTAFADIYTPATPRVRNDNVFSGPALMGVFERCTVKDEVDSVGRDIITLTCRLTEADGGIVTEASRAAFITDVVLPLNTLTTCFADMDGWVSYGNVESGFSAFLPMEAIDFVEENVQVSLKTLNVGAPPLGRAAITLEVRAGPRDYR